MEGIDDNEGQLLLCLCDGCRAAAFCHIAHFDCRSVGWSANETCVQYENSTLCSSMSAFLHKFYHQQSPVLNFDGGIVLFEACILLLVLVQRFYYCCVAFATAAFLL